MQPASSGLRVTCALLGGAVVGAIVSLFMLPSASILVGWDVAVVIYLAWVWSSVWRLDPGLTAQLAKREDPSTAVAELMVVGAGTARAERYAAVRPEELRPGLRHGQAPVPAIAVVTRRISLDLSSPLLTAALPGARTILITTEQAPPELRSEARRNADVIVAGEDTADLGFAVQALADRGYRRILAEGGPQLLGELAAAEVLDELCLTISPLVASGGASRIAVGTSAVQSGRLALQHVLEEEGHLFCRYTRRRPAVV